MTVWKTIRILGVSLALLALLVFSTTVVSDWDCHNSTDDTRCPYCHLTHQAPAKPEATYCVSVFEAVASVPLPEDAAPVTIPCSSQTTPRAPPAA
jgi:hypothetical protein